MHAAIIENPLYCCEAVGQDGSNGPIRNGTRCCPTAHEGAEVGETYTSRSRVQVCSLAWKIHHGELELTRDSLRSVTDECIDCFKLILPPQKSLRCSGCRGVIYCSTEVRSASLNFMRMTNPPFSAVNASRSMATVKAVVGP
jgi:hypothetical protein